MLIITVELNRPPGQAISIKEQIAMELDKYGDIRAVSVQGESSFSVKRKHPSNPTAL